MSKKLSWEAWAIAVLAKEAKAQKAEAAKEEKRKQSSAGKKQAPRRATVPLFAPKKAT